MADITEAILKLNTDEVAQNKPTSENLFSKIGANINALIDRRYPLTCEVKTSSGNWTCPSGVTKILVIGIGGGGGGGEGGEQTGGVFTDGDDGSTGSDSLFNSVKVGEAGAGGRGGETINIGGTNFALGGRGGASGGGGGALALDSTRPGFGGQGIILQGTEYGDGGDGGNGENSLCGAGGGGAPGKLGFYFLDVTPASVYAYTVGAGGSGGSGGDGSNGSAGSAGVLLIAYTTLISV